MGCLRRLADCRENTVHDEPHGEGRQEESGDLGDGLAAASLEDAHDDIAEDDAGEDKIGGEGWANHYYWKWIGQKKELRQGGWEGGERRAVGDDR